MKFLIIGDLHGHIPKFYVKDFDAIVAPGDFCSDKYHKTLIKKWIAFNNSGKNKKGYDQEEFFKKVLKIKNLELNKRDKMSLAQGRKVLSFLNSFEKPVFIVPGNWDKSYKTINKSDWSKLENKYKDIYREYSAKNTNRYLTSGLKNIQDCQLKLRTLDEYNFIGYGLSSFPEMPKESTINSKLRFKKIKKYYAQLFGLLKKEYLKRDKSKPTIFLTHNVPYKTHLDQIINKNSPVDGEHFGSRIARDFCIKYQPLLCIGGHMHEHFGKCNLGKTVCINAGFGGKVNVLLELKGSKISKIQFIDNSGQYQKITL